MRRNPRTETTLGVCFALALAGLLGARGAAAEEAGPRAVIEQTVDQVLAVLAEDGLASEKRRKKLEDIVYERFDFGTMSRLVLARNWRRLNEQQQVEFEREYREFLANTYGTRLDRYEQEKVEIVGEREEPRGDVTVMTRIVGGEFDGATVDYRLRSRNGPWLVIDVIIEGVSLVSNYRDQFKEVLSDGGPELLLEKLKEKNANPPPAEA